VPYDGLWTELQSDTSIFGSASTVAFATLVALLVVALVIGDQITNSYGSPDERWLTAVLGLLAAPGAFLFVCWAIGTDDIRDSRVTAVVEAVAEHEGLTPLASTSSSPALAAMPSVVRFDALDASSRPVEVTARLVVSPLRTTASGGLIADAPRDWLAVDVAPASG
jgi:hypothetical protein